MIQGGGAGMRELTRRHAEVGPLPLIAVGMAERLVRAKNFDTALPLFERAITGDLRGLRSRARVALDASQCAISANALEAAARMLDVAASEDETRAVAERRRLELAALGDNRFTARAALEELVRQASGTDKARALLKLGALLARDDAGAAAQVLAEAEPLSAPDRALHQRVVDEMARVIDPSAARARVDSEPEIVSESELEAVLCIHASAGDGPRPTGGRSAPALAAASQPERASTAMPAQVAPGGASDTLVDDVEAVDDDDDLVLEAMVEEGISAPPPSKRQTPEEAIASFGAAPRRDHEAPPAAQSRRPTPTPQPQPQPPPPTTLIDAPASAARGAALDGDRRAAVGRDARGSIRASKISCASSCARLARGGRAAPRRLRGEPARTRARRAGHPAADGAARAG